MANLAGWLAGSDQWDLDPMSNDAAMAVINWDIILQDSVSVRFNTGSSILNPQTVRLESDGRANPVLSAAGIAPKRGLVIFGIRNHPTVTDTDIQEGYYFNYLGDQYTIRDVILAEGEIQALAEATR